MKIVHSSGFAPYPIVELTVRYFLTPISWFRRKQWEKMEEKWKVKVLK